MKKRTLLVLVIGISFAPAVLANWGDEQIHTGQQTLASSLEHSPEGVGCNLPLDKKVVREVKGSGQKSEGNAISAR